jgi:hypothetical protein
MKVLPEHSTNNNRLRDVTKSGLIVLDWQKLGIFYLCIYTYLFIIYSLHILKNDLR